MADEPPLNHIKEENHGKIHINTDYKDIGEVV